MIYPVRGKPWSRKEIDDIVERLKARERPEPFLGHAADAIEFLKDEMQKLPVECPNCKEYLWNL